MAKRCASSLADHPTVVHIDSCIATPLERPLRTNSSKSPVGIGGIAAYNQEDSKQAMSKSGVYECTLTYSQLPLTTFAHSGAPISWGSVVRMYEDTYRDPVTKQPALGSHSEIAPISLRATSKVDAPAPAVTEVLDNDAERLAFGYGWAQAHAQRKGAPFEKVPEMSVR